MMGKQNISQIWIKAVLFRGSKLTFSHPRPTSHGTALPPLCAATFTRHAAEIEHRKIAGRRRSGRHRGSVDNRGEAFQIRTGRTFRNQPGRRRSGEQYINDLSYTGMYRFEINNDTQFWWILVNSTLQKTFGIVNQKHYTVFWIS